ncbi:hypothetical protein [Persicirhabdus sediminis]|uniref:Uncharacterized protein n=1 Tax=Persicirhabdus sediminis TaxID=454144 RepID=A0A8J7MDM2_9BACT|nr:hypothetical protein [Persicirhabdus sediminis]MBK1790588.1 hypothetical protein [Persicirhabdus sediminis]
MWTCKACNTKIEEDCWETCWNCNCPNNLTKEEFDEVAKLEEDDEDEKLYQCLRCEVTMKWIGKKRFHEGTRAWSFILGDLGELFVNQEHYNVFGCPKCGKIEFFGDVGNESFQEVSEINADMRSPFL